MIECVINGTKTYPSVSNGLKLVIENPAMRDKSSYTYDIVFPLNVSQNVKFFSRLNLLNVSVKIREFENCRLVVNNKTLFYGKGIITSVSNTEVKMQIIQEAQSSFPSELSDDYIDKLSYPAVDSRFKQAVFDYEGDTFEGDGHGILTFTDVKPELDANKFIGEKGKYTFVTTIPGDVSGDNIEESLNVLCLIVDTDDQRMPIFHLAVQPNLIYILENILEHYGYTYDISSLNVEPWKDLYIASAVKSLNLADALPHWTVSKFLEEIEKLFNVSFSFDDKYVVAKKIWESEASETVTIETENEFEKNYDEDGQDYSDTSNLTYQLEDTHDSTETLEREVLEKFSVVKYDSESSMKLAVANMSEKEKKTHLFATDETPELYYWHESDGDGDSDELRAVGLFRPLFRDVTADNQKELNITPVAIEEDEKPMFPYLQNVKGQYTSEPILRKLGEFSTTTPRVVVYTKNVVEDYLTVQDLIEDSESETTESDSKLELMFVGPLAYQVIKLEKNWGYYNIWKPVFNYGLPVTNEYLYSVGVKQASLSLNKCSTLKCIGELHVSQLEIDDSSGINKNEETILKFVMDNIPPINCLFLVRNKRYVAKQFEVQIVENGYSKEITGHFYELRS